MAQQWSFVAAGSGATGADPVPGMPSGWMPGDLLLVVGVCSTVSFSATPPAGWSEVARYTTGTPRMVVWLRTAVLGDTAPTCTNSGASSAAVMVAYRRLQSGTTDAVGSMAAAAGTSLATGTVSCSEVDELLFSIWGCGVSPASTTTITKDANVTTRVSKTASTSICAYNICDEYRSASGTTTTRTATTNRTVNLNAIQVAFKQHRMPLVIMPPIIPAKVQCYG